MFSIFRELKGYRNAKDRFLGLPFTIIVNCIKPKFLKKCDIVLKIPAILPKFIFVILFTLIFINKIIIKFQEIYK